MAVRRPCRRQDLPELRELDLPFGAGPGNIQNDESRLPVRDGRKGESLPGRTPRSSGSNRLQAFEPGAGRRVGQKKIKGQPIPFRKKDRLAPVWTEGRP